MLLRKSHTRTDDIGNALRTRQLVLYFEGLRVLSTVKPKLEDKRKYNEEINLKGTNYS